MQPMPLKERLRAAGRMARNAHIQFSLWRGISSVDAHKAHRPVLNEYWEHLRFTKQAHLVASLVELHSLHKKNRRTINLQDLILEMKREGWNVAGAQKSLEEVRVATDKIEVLRNEALAHRSRIQSYDEVFRAAEITPAEIQDAIDVGVEVVSILLLLIGEESQIVDELPQHSLDRMLTNLRHD